jgi:hypothetical protein
MDITAKPKVTHFESRQSRLAIASQNKKRSNATTQKPAQSCFTFYFAKPHPDTDTTFNFNQDI